MKVVDVVPASVEDLCQFHCSLYVDFLRKISENYTSSTDESKEHVIDVFSTESDDFGIGTVDLIYFMLSIK